MLKGTIKVRTASNYGTQRIYPACGVALLLAQLAGTKTLTEAALQTLLTTGIEVQQQFTHGVCVAIKSPADLVY
jgi:hypothetical protein